MSILATVERAIEAGAARDDADGIGRRWPPESYTSRRNPKRFALAEVKRLVFFRLATRNLFNAWGGWGEERYTPYSNFVPALTD